MKVWLRLLLRLVLVVIAERNIVSGFSCAPIFLVTTAASPSNPSSSNSNRYKQHSRWHRRQELYAGTNGGRSDLCPQNAKGIDAGAGTADSSLDRRSFLCTSPFAILGSAASSLVFGRTFFRPEPAVAIPGSAENRKDSDGRLADSVVQSLVFEKVLGSGSYKTVYLVSARLPETSDNTGTTKAIRYAMAVERLRNKRDVKNAFRGVRIPESIQEGVNDDERDLFETIVDWWVQPSNVPEFAQGGRVFPSSAGAARSRSEPKKNFAGSRWMVSLKPVYETDFKRFIRNSPALFPVGRVGVEKSYYWTESTLLAFVLEILHAGKLMHQAGIVHRDIKPKNMMIYNVPSSSGKFVKKPVIIDYGFAEFGTPLLPVNGRAAGSDICVERPGQLKGEVDYVVAEDLANYRGCQRGDAYAMGKTMYEFVFGSLELQEQSRNEEEVISVEGATIRNQIFRNRLYNDPKAGTESRFPLTIDSAECLLSIIKGLCGNPKDAARALSFAEAENILSGYLTSTAGTQS